jgi:hypothetical protein
LSSVFAARTSLTHSRRRGKPSNKQRRVVTKGGSSEFRCFFASHIFEAGKKDSRNSCGARRGAPAFVAPRRLLVAAKMRAKMAMSIDLDDGWARFDS